MVPNPISTKGEIMPTKWYWHSWIFQTFRRPWNLLENQSIPEVPEVQNVKKIDKVNKVQDLRGNKHEKIEVIKRISKTKNSDGKISL